MDKELVEALKPFSDALSRAEETIDCNATYRETHVVRTTGFFLSYNDFDRARKIISRLAP